MPLRAIPSCIPVLSAFTILGLPAPAVNAAEIAFIGREIGRDLGVVYAVAVADMNRDGRPDVVAINGTQVMWFESPAWTKHVVLDGGTGPATKPDNVCFAVHDIDGDGWPDIALGADWQPTNTESGGSLQWIRRDPAKPDGPWQVFPLGSEPTLHRMRWGDVDGDGKLELMVKPLHGRGTRGPDWEGQGLRLMAWRPGADPTRPWTMEVVDSSLHIGHNMTFDGRTLLVAVKEGVFAFSRVGRGRGARWTRAKIGEGNPGEVRVGRVRTVGGKRARAVKHLATIQPWHGTRLVVYRDPGGKPGRKLWPSEVLAEGLTEGHALGWGDFDGDGSDEVVAGWRKPPVGVALWRRGADGAWARTTIDAGGMAAEDMAVADLDGDGRPEIVAGGRATSNIKIYSVAR